MARFKNIITSVMAAADDFRNSSADYAASFFAPIREAKTKSGEIPRYGRDNQVLQNFQVPSTADSPRVDTNITTSEFDCKVHRAGNILAFEDEEFDDTDLLSPTELSLQNEEALAIEREMAVATIVNNYSSFTLNGTPTTKVNAPGGDIGEFVANAKIAVRNKINRWPNKMAASGDLAVWLQKTVAQLGFGGGKTALASWADVAAFFGLDEFRPVVAQYNSAKPGKTAVGAGMYTANRLWLFRGETAGTTKTPGFLVTPEYRRLSTPRIKELGAPHVEGLYIESRFCYDLVQVDLNACYAAYDLLTT